MNCNELTIAGLALMVEAVKTISTRPPGANESIAVAKSNSVKSENK